MMTRTRVALLVTVAWPALSAVDSMDSTRGERLYSTLSCARCHDSKGVKGEVDRDFTRAALASLMWNHAPVMWEQMETRGIKPGDLDEQGAADLFAWFFARRYFEKPGDAARGKRVFSDRH